MIGLDKISEVNIPAAHIKLGDESYLVTSGPVTYIMQWVKQKNGGGWKDVEPIPEHMEEIRQVVKYLWDVII